MTLIRTPPLTIPEIANFAVAVLFQVVSELGKIETAFLLNKDKGKSFEPNDYVIMGYVIMNTVTMVTNQFSTKYLVFNHFQLTEVKPFFDLNF